MQSEIIEAKSVEERAQAVSTLIRQTVSSWMEVAKHVHSAKSELVDADYKLFVRLIGLSESICTKLVSVAKCKKIYSGDLSKHLYRLEGWTNLYEVSKLDNSEFDEFVQKIDDDQQVPVTREFIQKFKKASPKSASKKTIVATLSFDKDDTARLDLCEFQKIKDAIDEIQRSIDRLSPAVTINVYTKIINDFESEIMNQNGHVYAGENDQTSLECLGREEYENNIEAENYEGETL